MDTAESLLEELWKMGAERDWWAASAPMFHVSGEMQSRIQAVLITSKATKTAVGDDELDRLIERELDHVDQQEEIASVLRGYKSLRRDLAALLTGGRGHHSGRCRFCDREMFDDDGVTEDTHNEGCPLEALARQHGFTIQSEYLPGASGG